MTVATYVRSVVLTRLTVTAAAKRLGVGRPALSNMLNGNAAISPEMALKLQRTFRLDARELLVAQLDENLDALKRRKK
jgi:addiction module HigA family antidote